MIENIEELISDLRAMADIINESEGRASVVMLSGDLFEEAADVIETTHERLHNALSYLNDLVYEYYRNTSVDDGYKRPPSIDSSLIQKQKDWSSSTFGPGRRTEGILDHIRKELDEIQAKPDDIVEWVDVILLAIDGAWRHGGQPQEIINLVREKQFLNRTRAWPDWKYFGENEAITHIEIKNEQ